MNYFSLLILSLLLPSSLTHTIKSFPELNGETLDRKRVVLPADCKGKKTLIGMASSHKAQEALMTWYEPVFEKFVAKVGMFDYQYDVNLYFIPMFIGLKQALYESTIKELKSENRKDLYPYILFYKGELEPYDKLLNMTEKSAAYFFVLNEEVKILYETNGEFTEKKMEEIETVLGKK